MVSNFQSETFDEETTGRQDVQSLITSARDLYQRLTAITSYLLAPGIKNFTTIPRSATKGFLQSLDGFYTCYTTWEVPDKAGLVLRMKRAMIALLDANGSHIDTPSTAIEIGVHLDRIYVKLCKFADQDELMEINKELVETIEIAITKLQDSLMTTEDTQKRVLTQDAIDRQSLQLLRFSGGLTTEVARS